MKKVVHVIVGTDVGGAELTLKKIILHPESKGIISHSVISLTTIGAIGKELLDNDVEVFALGARNWISKLKLIVNLIKEISRRKPDVVHTWMYHSDFLGAIAAKICRVPRVVWCVRSNDITKGTSILTVMVRRLCALSSRLLPDVIVFAAEVSKRTHIALGYDPEKSIVIANGFDCRGYRRIDIDREAARRSMGISDTDLCITSVARFNQVKDHSTFIRMASILLAEYSNLVFVLVGRGNTENNDQLLAMLEHHGIRERFVLVGEVLNPYYYLSASDVFCLHSITEGFPNSLGEAMLSGLPCVITDVGDAALLLNDSRFVAPPSDPKALATVVAQLLLMSNAEREIIGQKARQRILDHFELGETVRNYLSVYRH